MKFLAFGASTSKASINKRFVAYIGTYFEGTEVIDLNDFELPIYSIDLEEESGIPENVIRFYDKLSAADIIIISLAEHNGTYTAAFKNLFDWTSRYKSKLFESKRLILAATSPGQRGGKGVMDAALLRFPIHGADILGHFCFPKFQENYNENEGITNPELQKEFAQFITDIKSKI